MLREPDWSREAFEILLGNPQLTPEELSDQLPRRPVDAIQTI